MATKFITVRIEIMHDKNLSPNQKFILAEIEQLCTLDGGCFASNKHFSELIGITTQGVSKAINRLVEMEYITSKVLIGSRNRERIIRAVNGINSGKSGINSGKSGINSGVESKDNKTSNKTVNRASVFKKPSLEDVAQYIREKDLSVKAQDFITYFEANDWIDSNGKKVRSWKQKLLTWNNHSKQQKTPTKRKWG